MCYSYDFSDRFFQWMFKVISSYVLCEEGEDLWSGDRK